KYGIHFHSENNRIRCLAHVVNLVVQAILKALDEAESSDDVDYFLLNKDQPIHYNAEDDEELKEMEGEKHKTDATQDNDDDGDANLPPNVVSLSALKRLRLITTKISSSPQRRESFRQCARSVYTSQGKPAVSSSGTPLEKLMAIDEWTFRNKDFRSVSLREDDWDQLRQIERVLEVFTSVTLQMSRSDTPTIPYVLPMYRHMEVTLQELETDVALSFSIQTAITVGLEKLAKYHELAKRNQFYIIATICHPHFRLDWFKTSPADDYNYAKTIFDTVYNEYKAAIPSRPSGVSPQQPTNMPSLEASASFLLRLKSTQSAVAGPVASNLQNIAPPEKTLSELERYVSGEGGEGEISKPLDWWRV
ncbi:ribonuclease H-like domain-containing protein, partial [Lentinula raphanica]